MPMGWTFLEIGSLEARVMRRRRRVIPRDLKFTEIKHVVDILESLFSPQDSKFIEIKPITGILEPLFPETNSS